MGRSIYLMERVNILNRYFDCPGHHDIFRTQSFADRLQFKYE